MMIDGKPLYEYATEKAIESSLISEVFISTDSDMVNKEINNKVRVIPRSEESSTDVASTELVISEFLVNYKCDILVLIQATNIFLKDGDLDNAINKFIENRDSIDCLLSVVKTKYLIWRNTDKGFFSHNYDYLNRPRSQNISDAEYIENGAFYIFERENFLKHKNRLHGRIGYYEMSKESLFEIDDPEDLISVGKLIKKNT